MRDASITRDPHALIAYLEEREGWAFGYTRAARTQDCARWAAGGVQAVAGVNPLDRFTSQWTTRRGARRVLTTHGGMAAAVDQVMTEISPTLAQRGDVGMSAEGQLLLFEGDLVVGLAPGSGYVRAPRAHAVRAWTL